MQIPDRAFHLSGAIAGIAGLYSVSSVRSALGKIARLERKKKRISRTARREFSGIAKEKFNNGSWLEHVDVRQLSDSETKVLSKYEKILDEIEQEKGKLNRLYLLLALSVFVGGAALGGYQFKQELISRRKAEEWAVKLRNLREKIARQTTESVGDDVENCIICFSPLISKLSEQDVNDKRSLAVILPCGHGFCLDCITMWYNERRSYPSGPICPICKAPSKGWAINAADGELVRF